MRYVNDQLSGIQRKKIKNGFRYVDSEGKPVRNKVILDRIKSLGIPPAWQDVWISPWENGHIQATGRDDKGRKQYRYHARWREVRDEAKYTRMVNFGRMLPKLREHITAELNQPGFPREKVLAIIIRLLELTLVRVGNEEYARTNKSFGLTTLRNKHVHINGSEVEFQFRGKSRVQHALKLHDRRLANIIKRMRDLPGQELFQYVDEEGKRHAISSDDVNNYLRTLTGEDYTAKDFRTWAGTMLATAILLEQEEYAPTQAKKNVDQAIKEVAKKLGNTPRICRNCYVHPMLIECYMDEKKWQAWQAHMTRWRANNEELDDIEEAVLTLFEQEMEKTAEIKNGDY
ncbi:MAG TPA: DNA topoisomerase IB [Methylophilaceae bacterium]|nr:DNA topoisomerase IB [Methylophilaceae bacterium]